MLPETKRSIPQNVCMKGVIVTIWAGLGVSCVWFISPDHNFGEKQHPLAPDYNLKRNWSALPDMKDSADILPSRSNLTDEQGSAKADVFFIHPTTTWERNQWNESLEDETVNQRTDIESTRGMASIFNCCARVYAPRYRQAILASFIDEQDNGSRALDLAYEDVVRAFDFYLANYNQGRPFVLAGHSQGAGLAERLLKERVRNPEIRPKFVVAYLVGATIDSNKISSFLPCENESQTNCYVSWNTFGSGGKPILFPEKFTKSVCINPLSWRRDEVYVGFDANLGGVSEHFEKVDIGVAGAQCKSGILYVSDVKNRGYSSNPGKSYHKSDYGLFYMNIRKNVEKRINHFLAN